MAEKAAEAGRQAVVVIEAAAPADLMTRPADELSAAEGLARGSLSGLRRLIEIVEAPLDVDDVKRARLVGEMALGLNKLFARANEGAMRAKRDDALSVLLDELLRERDKKTIEGVIID